MNETKMIGISTAIISGRDSLFTLTPIPIFIYTNRHF